MDIDGALLVKTPELEGGFTWEDGGRVVPCTSGYGLRVKADCIF